MTVLIVVAVEQERAAVIRDAPPAADLDVIVSGVGPVAAATATATALAARSYTVVISAGICGGLSGRADIGDVVVGTASVAADLGCRTDEGFRTLDDMGLAQPSRIEFSCGGAWARRLGTSKLRVRAGEVLTLSCMTGTDVGAKNLSVRYPDAVAEAMEGFGVAWAAHANGVDAGEIRAVSNIVGKRDPSTWDIASAFDALSGAFGALLSGPL